MTIDIIDLNDPQFSDLNPVQMSMVRVAQQKKNNIEARVTSEIDSLLTLLLGNETVRGSMYDRERARIRADADDEIEGVREDLLYQLAYEAMGSEGNDAGPYRYPENPNYNLSYSQRFLVVRQYYMDAVSEPYARLEAYRMDTLARTYLGDFYETLYDILAGYCK